MKHSAVAIVCLLTLVASVVTACDDDGVTPRCSEMPLVDDTVGGADGLGPPDPLTTDPEFREWRNRAQEEDCITGFLEQGFAGARF